MAAARLSTADYPQEARERLAEAVKRARDTAGYWSQQQLADRAVVSKRSIVYLENAEPRVGRRVLEAIGRALPGWTVDTARQILDDAPRPEPVFPDRIPTRPAPKPEDYPDRMAYYIASFDYMRDELGLSAEGILSGYAAAKQYREARELAEREDAERD